MTHELLFEIKQDWWHKDLHRLKGSTTMRPLLLLHVLKPSESFLLMLLIKASKFTKWMLRVPFLTVNLTLKYMFNSSPVLLIFLFQTTDTNSVRLSTDSSRILRHGTRPSPIFSSTPVFEEEF